MARQKSYERSEVEEQACLAFWKHGYRALGIRAIEDSIGLGRFAIRTEFGGKDGLFLEALKAYRERGKKYIISPIEQARDLAALQTLLVASAAPPEVPGNISGCFFVNTMIENVALQNPLFQEQVDGHFNDVRRATADLVNRAKKSGDVKTGIDGVVAGDFVAGSLIAIGAMTRETGSASFALGYVKMANETIASWRC